MKIYFGNANEDLFSDGLFEFNGSQYYYGAEYGTNAGGLDEVRIFDGCKRYLPIHVQAIPELIAALQEVQMVQEALDRARDLTDRAESNAKGAIQESWEDYFEVKFDQE